MKTIAKTDSIPRESKGIIERQITRAMKFGLTVEEICDTISETGLKFRTLVLKGSRWSFIKYWGTDLLTGNCEITAVPEVLKCMLR